MSIKIIDIGKLDRSTVILLAESYYRAGVEELHLLYEKPNFYHYRKEESISVQDLLKQVMKRFLDVRLSESTEKKSVLVFNDEQIPFGELLKKIMEGMEETNALLLHALQQGTSLEVLEDKHYDISRYSNKALRMLQKKGYPVRAHTINVGYILGSFERVMDIYKYLARECTSLNFSSLISVLVEMVGNSLALYKHFFFSYDLAIVEKLNKNRDAIKHELRRHISQLPGSDVAVIMYLTNILDTLFELCEFRIPLE